MSVAFKILVIDAHSRINSNIGLNERDFPNLKNVDKIGIFLV